MRRLGTEGWSGLAMLVLAVAVAAPVLFVPIEPRIPRGWWVVLFLLFLAALIVSTAAAGSPLLRHGGFAVAVISAWVVVLTSPGLGLLLILLVITAAISVYILPLQGSFVIVGLNTVVVAVFTARTAPDAAESAILTGFYLLIQLATMLSTATLIREQRMRRELSEAHVELQAASILLSESARTAERLRISRELHDTIGHQLTVLTLELETARHLDGDDGREHLDRADRVVRELLRDVRTVVGQLRTEPPDLERALKGMTDGLPGLEVTIEVSPQLRLDEDQSAVLVRAAQEVVTNTIRHAQAGELHIEIADDEEGIVFRASDDGRGARDAVFGNGLTGLSERFAELGGGVVVEGRGGFSVTARMPLT